MLEKPPLIASPPSAFLLGPPRPAARRPCSRCGCELVVAPSSRRAVDAGQVQLLCDPCCRCLHPGLWIATLLPGAVAEVATLARADARRN